MAVARFLLPSALLVCAATAPAQRLPYRDVLGDDPSERLLYRSGLEPSGGTITAEPGPAGEQVRAFYGDRFEWFPVRGRDAYSWDASAEIGGATHRLWLASTGDGTFGGPLEYLEVQALYSRPLGQSGLSLQAGVRRDFIPRPRRTYGVLGVQGSFGDLYVGGFGFLSHRGELTGRVSAYYDLPLGRRLTVQPAFETEIAAADVPELGIGAGPLFIEAGLRLRYRIAEAFSPYVGFSWERLLGRTARFARDAGDEVDNASLVLGVRSYF